MWYDENSKDFDVAISTRIRIARNLNDFKFPHTLNKKEASEVLNKIKQVTNKEKYDYFYTNDIDDSTLLSLVEKHLISKEFINLENTAILQSKDSSIVCMINEEDHLRIQGFVGGFDVEKCYDKIKTFENEMSEKLEFAKSEKYGYLTSCPTNVGTGVRVSVLLHLQGLATLGILDDILNQVRDIGLSVRGLYGENTSGYGHMYQISNQKTLGITDLDIVSKVSIVVSSLIEQERRARNIIKARGADFEDKVYRAYGILKNARKISEDEAFKLLSLVRIGASINMLKDLNITNVQNVFNNMQTNSLKLLLKQDMDAKEEQIKRAKYIREELR